MIRPSLFSISFVLLALSFSFLISESVSAQTTLSNREISNLEDRVLQALATEEYADMLRPLDQLRSAGVEISGEILFYEAKAYYHGRGDLLKARDLLRVYLEDENAQRRNDAIALNEQIGPTVHVDLTAYREAVFSGDPAQIRAYRERFNNPVMSEASFQLEQELMIEKARESSEIALYEEYLSVFPDGTFSTEAAHAIDNLAFRSAERENTVEAYREYIRSQPEGAFRRRAINNSINLIDQERSTVLELLRQSNRKRYFLIFTNVAFGGIGGIGALGALANGGFYKDDDATLNPVLIAMVVGGSIGYGISFNAVRKQYEVTHRYRTQLSNLRDQRISLRNKLHGRADNGTFQRPVTALIAPAYIPQNRSLGLTLSVSF